MAGKPKLGSGERFRKLSSTLASRGASNPDALAAWIGRRKYGAKRMGALSHAHAQDALTGLLLSFTGESDESGQRLPSGKLTCPNCGHSGTASDFSGNDLSPGSSRPGELRTPTGNVSSTIAGMNAGQIATRSSGTYPAQRQDGPGSGRALANSGQRAIGLARRSPVGSATDILVSREGGRAVVRHRQGGVKIGEVWRGDDGSWTSAPDGGRQLSPHSHQRGALMELLGTWNRSATRPDRWALPLPAAQAPQQTDLMAAYGIPAVRALATPARGAGDGPRITLAGGSGDGGQPGASGSGPAGLSPRGQAIYKKLIAKGFPAARALAFARNSQNTKPGQFGRRPAAAGASS